MRWGTAAVMMALAVMVLPGSPSAQEVEIKAPAPTRRAPEPIVIPPGDHAEVTRPSDADYYPNPPRVRHEPAFIGPLSVKNPETRRRAGVAGWTAPSTPTGPAQISREVSGWFAFGLAFELNGPPAEIEERP